MLSVPLRALGAMMPLLALLACGTAGEGGQRGGNACAEAGTQPCVESVRGRLVDSDGHGIEEVQVTVCGIVCYVGSSVDDGNFEVAVSARLDPSEYSLQTHGRPHLTSVYFPLPDEVDAAAIELGELLMLDMPASGAELVSRTDDQGAPEQMVTSNGVTLEVPEGVGVWLDIEAVLEGEQAQRFRALEIPEVYHDHYAPAVGAELLYALDPFAANFRDSASDEPSSARLGFSNPKGWQAGTRVEVLALGTYLDPEWITPGRYEVVAQALVSEDEALLEFEGRGDLRWLTWVALRRE